jgi:hypothetical protein
MHQAKECVFRHYGLSAISHEIRFLQPAWLDSRPRISELEIYLIRHLKLLLSLYTILKTLKITVFIALNPVFKGKNDKLFAIFQQVCRS